MMNEEGRGRDKNAADEANDDGGRVVLVLWCIVEIVCQSSQPGCFKRTANEDVDDDCDEDEGTEKILRPTCR